MDKKTIWKPIARFRKGDFVKCDLWMQWGASPLTMGMGDSFRVSDAYRRDGKWYHRESYQEKELNADYITHYAERPVGPNGEKDY
jgi:hypothetical protein